MVLKRRGAVLVLTLCLLPAAGCGSTSAQPNLRRLALKLSDLPPATHLDSARTWTNAQAAARDNVPTNLYVNHGRVTSYRTRFERRIMNGSEPTWLLQADSELTEFRDRTRARWGYSRLETQMRKSFVWSATTLGTNSGQARVRAAFRPLPLPPLGDRDGGFTVDSGGDEVAFTTRVVVFQRNRFVVFLRVFGLVDNVAVSRVLRLARAVDHRLTATRID